MNGAASSRPFLLIVILCMVFIYLFPSIVYMLPNLLYGGQR